MARRRAREEPNRARVRWSMEVEYAEAEEWAEFLGEEAEGSEWTNVELLSEIAKGLFRAWQAGKAGRDRLP